MAAAKNPRRAFTGDLKLLFDHNVPAYLLAIFPDASTAFLQGWADLSNGRLVDAAEVAGFGVLITLDRGFQSQQNMMDRRIAIAILACRDQSRPEFEEVAARLLEHVDRLGPGSVTIFV